MSEEAPQFLCPVCALIHEHDVRLVVEEDANARPRVWCPCPRCKANGLTWDTQEEYQYDWLPKHMPGLEHQASEIARAKAGDNEPPPTPGEAADDAEWAKKLEEMEDEHKWDIKRRAREGNTPPVQDAWDGATPPD